MLSEGAGFQNPLLQRLFMRKKGKNTRKLSEQSRITLWPSGRISFIMSCIKEEIFILDRGGLEELKEVKRLISFRPINAAPGPFSNCGQRPENFEIMVDEEEGYRKIRRIPLGGLSSKDL
jgi:hypothetical protein